MHIVSIADICNEMICNEMIQHVFLKKKKKKEIYFKGTSAEFVTQSAMR